MVHEPPPGTRVLATAGGRQLEVLSTGPEDGLVLLFHNGTPGGLVASPDMAAAAAARGLRTVMYARPGYGDSTARPGRRIADAAADAATVLDGLGARQFVTVGWSGAVPVAIWPGEQDRMVPFSHDLAGRPPAIRGAAPGP